MEDKGCRKGQLVYEPYKYYYFEDDDSPSSIRQEFCYKDGSSYSWINSSYFEIPSTEVDGINLNDGAIIIIDNKNYYRLSSDYKYDKNHNILIYTRSPNYGKDLIIQDIDEYCVFNDESLPSNHSYLIKQYYVLDNSNKQYIEYTCENKSLNSSIVDVINAQYSKHEFDGPFTLTKDPKNSNKYTLVDEKYSSSTDLYLYKDNIYMNSCSYNSLLNKYVDHNGNLVDDLKLYNIYKIIIISVIIAIVLICLIGWLTKKWLICIVIIIFATIIIDLIIHFINKDRCTSIFDTSYVELIKM